MQTLCLCIFVLFLFVFLSVCYSWWPDSLFLVDTGIFFCPTTSCRPCHPAFLQSFHRCSECACFLWLSTEILCLHESVDFLSFLDMYFPVFLVLLVCVCVCLCHDVYRQINRHSREISEIGPAQTRALCLCTYIFVLFLFFFLSIHYSWWPNSLFLLDTGSFI